MSNIKRTKLDEMYRSIRDKEKTSFVSILDEGVMLVTDDCYLNDGFKEYVQNKRYEEFHSTGKLTKAKFLSLLDYEKDPESIESFPGCIQEEDVIKLDPKYSKVARFIFDLPRRYQTIKDKTSNNLMFFTSDCKKETLDEYLNYMVDYCFDMNGLLNGTNFKYKESYDRKPNFSCEFIFENGATGCYNNAKCLNDFGEVDKQNMSKGLQYEIKTAQIYNPKLPEIFEM